MQGSSITVNQTLYGFAQHPAADLLLPLSLILIFPSLIRPHTTAEVPVIFQGRSAY